MKQPAIGRTPFRLVLWIIHFSGVKLIFFCKSSSEFLRKIKIFQLHGVLFDQESLAGGLKPSKSLQRLTCYLSSCKSGPNRLQARFLESNISLVQNRNSIVLPLTFQRYQSSLPFQLNHFSISSHLISVCLFKNVSGDNANVHWWEDSKAFPKWILCTAWTASESFLSHISYN